MTSPASPSIASITQLAEANHALTDQLSNNLLALEEQIQETTPPSREQATAYLFIRTMQLLHKGDHLPHWMKMVAQQGGDSEMSPPSRSETIAMTEQLRAAYRQACEDYVTLTNPQQQQEITRLSRRRFLHYTAAGTGAVMGALLTSPFAKNEPKDYVVVAGSTLLGTGSFAMMGDLLQQRLNQHTVKNALATLMKEAGLPPEQGVERLFASMDATGRTEHALGI